MNITTLLHTFRDAIHDDSETLSWCNATYGQAHKVYVNMDERNPPAEDDCPYVVIYPTGKAVGREVDGKQHGIMIVCCIHDEDLKTGVEAGANTVEYEGVERIETFRKLVEDAIAALDLGNGIISTLDIEYETIEAFPFLMAGMAVGVNEPVLIGSDPLE